MSSYRKTMGEAYNGMYLVEGNIDKIKDIVSKKSASKIDGVTVDMFTASAISQIYDKVNDANKKKMEKLPITKLAALAMKMMKNEYVPEELDLDEGPNKITQPVIVMRHKDNKNLSVSVLPSAKNIKEKEKKGMRIDHALVPSPSGNAREVKDPKEIMKLIKGGDKLKIGEELDLVEGTWAMPDSSKKLKGLMQVLKRPIPLGKGGDSAVSVIRDFIGDDELYDDLGDAGDKNPKGDARPIIMKAMKRLKITQKNAEVEMDEKLDKDDETIVKKVVDKLKKASQAHAGQSKDLQKAIDEDGHTDVVSAQNNVKVAMSALTKMSGELSKLNPEDALPSWWTNKVAVAVDKIDGMADYLDTQVEEVELGERLDPADVDDDATDDDIKSADKNIMMQLRKSISLRGNFPVEFMDKKKIRVPAKVAQAVQSKYNSLRKPNDKEKFQSQVAKSYKDMLGAIKEAVSPAQQAAIAISKKERGEKPKKESRFNTINKQLKGEK